MEKADRQYLTLVFKDPPKELISELTHKEGCVFMSWSHVPNELSKLVQQNKNTAK